MTTGDPTVDALVVLIAVIVLVALFVAAQAAFWLAERFIPGFSDFLDRHMPDPDWRKGW